jgi:iron complex outermembrane receptor protein
MLSTTCLGITLVLASASPGVPDPDDLLGLSIEQLGGVEVTATSRRASRLADTPASVHVIDGEQIRALGIRTLPEALRLAPNLHVARINAAGYAVSARGLKTSLSNKMLVLVDGRPIYTPLFAGVLWDMQDVPIADVDRIEVVSGPGAAAWGANAVNGVINIVTRPAREAQGGYASAWAGEEGRGIEAGQTLAAGTSGALRLYGKRREQDPSVDRSGRDIQDAWTQEQAGFRGDWTRGDAELRVQGDMFRARATERPTGTLRADGYNLTARWTRGVSSDAQWTVLGYVDRVHRTDPIVIDDRMDIASLEVVRATTRGAHRLTWGLGYRHARDRSSRGLLARLQPDERDLEWAHAFVQDEIALSPRLVAHLGLRFDTNSYTGLEVLPTARLSYTPDAGSIVWGAASRAVRSPSRFDREFFFPATEPHFIRGGPDFRSETADVVELGYRSQLGDHVSVSVTGFHHWYDHLRGGRPAPQGGVFVSNAAKARTWGMEAWATARVANAWEIAAGVLELRQHRELRPGFSGSSTLRDQGNDPEHQVLLRATRRFGEHHQVSAFARYVSALPAPAVPDYVQLDARWSYRPSRHVELGVGARNLLDERHAELEPANGLPQSEFGRAAYVDLRLDW